MLKKSLLIIGLGLVTCSALHAQTVMSMDEQIARIQAAEQEIREYNAAQEAMRAEAQKRAADIQKRAQEAAARAKAQKEKAAAQARAAKEKAQAARQAKLDGYSDTERELDIEMKRLEVEKKRIELEALKAQLTNPAPVATTTTSQTP